MLLINTSFFSLTENPDKVYIFVIKDENCSEEDCLLLVQSLQMICNATVKLNTVVFDASRLTSFSLSKKMLMESFQGMKNTGLSMFVLVTVSTAIICMTNIIKHCCASEKIVHTCKSMDEAMIILSEKKTS